MLVLSWSDFTFKKQNKNPGLLLLVISEISKLSIQMAETRTSLGQGPPSSLLRHLPGLGSSAPADNGLSSHAHMQYHSRSKQANADLCCCGCIQVYDIVAASSD